MARGTSICLYCFWCLVILFNLAGFLGYLLATVYFHSLKVSTLN